MKMIHFLAMTLPLCLGACSYAYDVKAVVINGRLAFVVDPKSRHDPSCFNAIEVVARSEARTSALPSDDVSLVEHGTFWNERSDSECIDKFPIFYGQSLNGNSNPGEQRLRRVAAKPLRVGVVYEISITSGATGYGGGAFNILPDRRVVNVPYKTFIGDQESVSSNAN